MSELTGPGVVTEIEAAFFDTVRAFPHLAHAVDLVVTEPGTAYTTPEGSLTALVMGPQEPANAEEPAEVAWLPRRPTADEQATPGGSGLDAVPDSLGPDAA